MTDGIGNIDETGNFGGDWIGVLPNNFINNSCYLLGRQRANFSLHNFYGESGLTFANFPDQFTYSTMIYVDEPLKTTSVHILLEFLVLMVFVVFLILARIHLMLPHHHLLLIQLLFLKILLLILVGHILQVRGKKVQICHCGLMVLK